MTVIRLDQDMHVHSTFSDGKHTMRENLEAAVNRGLERITCVDHVRQDTSWIPEFVGTARRLEAHYPLKVSCGVEAKLLNMSGELDLPSDLGSVDYIYAADHQFPFAAGCHRPQAIRAMRRAGTVSAAQLIEALVEATCIMLARYGNKQPKVVIAHLFSILPKVGLSEEDVSEAQLARLAGSAARAGAFIEVDERWRCPNARTLRAFRTAGVTILASTDSHTKHAIGIYEYAATVKRELEAS